MPKTKNENRLSVFYVEQSSRDHSYLYRMGRQRGVAGGAPGQFDGAWLGYSLNPTWRINGIAGTLVDAGGDIEKTHFNSLSVDLTRAPEQWSGSAYLVEQHVGPIVERQALGVESNFYDADQNYSALVDYDLLFKSVNIAFLQGNWTTESGNNYLMLMDRRRSPQLQITAALPAYGATSIPALVQTGVATTDKLRADAKALTQTSTLFMVGLTHPYSTSWRLSGDIRVNNISSTEAVGLAIAQPSTGNIYTYSAQAIGNNLLFKNDLGVISTSYAHAQTYGAQSLSFTQVQTFRDKLRMDVSLQFYNQKDYLDVRQTRFTPSVKLGYRFTESVSLDGEGGIENTRTTSPTNTEQVKRTYFYLSYRWDFR